MHYLVFGINVQINSVSLTSLVSTRLLIHLSTRLCHHPRSHHPSLLHSFTPGSNLFNKSFQPHDFFCLLDCLMITGLDRIYHVHHFIFSFTFYFFCLFPVVD